VSSILFPFSIYRALIVNSWLQEPLLDLSSVPEVSANEASTGTMRNVEPIASPSAEQPAQPLVAVPILQMQRAPVQSLTAGLPAPTTQTLPSRMVFHEAQEAIKPLLSGIQTQEQLEDLLGSLAELRYVGYSSQPCMF
jgi:hypothetical protein